MKNEEKKKWYQTGEFEDGYQFGDIFRTVKNSISEKKDKLEQKSNTVVFNTPKAAVENGKLNFDLGAQLYNFKDENERIDYIKENPELYASMGGNKYVPAGTPLRNTDSITKSNEAIQRIFERFKNIDAKKVQDAINAVGSGQWLDADTMKKYTDTVNTYVNDYVALEKLGYFNSLSEEERKGYAELLKMVKNIANNNKKVFADFEDEYSYKTDNIDNLSSNEILDYIDETDKRINSIKNGDTYQTNEQVVESSYGETIKGKKKVIVSEKEISKLKENREVASDALKTEFYKRYGSMTWEELDDAEEKIKDSLLKKTDDGNGSLRELQYIKTLRNGFENAEAYNNYVETVNMPFNELTKKFLEIRRVLQKFNEIEESRRVTYAQQYAEFGSTLRNQDYSEEEIYQMLTDDSDGYFKMLKDAEANLQIDEKYGGIDALRSQYALLEELYYRTYTNKKVTDMILSANEDSQYSYYVEQGKKQLKKNKYMTDTEYEVACYYKAKDGRNGNEYLEEIEDELQRREMKDRQQKFASFADKMPITASVVSIPLNIIAAGEQVVDAAKFMMTGDVDYNTNSLGASAIRGTVANKIDNPIGSFTYNTTMSGMDSLAAMGLSKAITGSGNVGSFILGLSAAGNATNDAISRGMSDGYAFANGVAAGIFESIFERWSFGKFSEGLDNLRLRDVEELSGFFAKNLYNNVLEEEYTYIANVSYDIIVNGKYSQYETAIRNYMILGFTETEAKKKVALELADEVAKTAASGALMSFGFSSLGVASTVVVDQINKNIDMVTQKLQSRTTNVVTKPINSYPAEKQGIIKSFLNSVDNGLNDFVERVKNGSKKFERYKISEVNEREANDIKNLLGIDVRGYTHNINSDSIKHIINRHGENGQNDNTMSNVDDIARVGWVIDNYDTIEIVTKNGELVYSSLFTDKNNRPAPQIRYSKKINGTYYVVEAVFENKYNKIWVQSAYLNNKKEAVTQAPDAANRFPMVTPKTPPASPASGISLSQAGEKVNNDYIWKEANSQGENASFFVEDYSGKSTPKIDPDEVIAGMWEDSPNKSKNNVEKSQFESVENVGENGIIEETRVLTLDNLTKDVLKTKPLYSPRPKRWLKQGGKIEIAADGNWIYTDLDGIRVKYTDGYPDFEAAGVVEQKVNIDGFKNRTSDVRKANALLSGYPYKKGYVWHHSQDGQTMMLIKEEIHKKFTHRGGFSLMKMIRRE